MKINGWSSHNHKLYNHLCHIHVHVDKLLNDNCFIFFTKYFSHLPLVSLFFIIIIKNRQYDRKIMRSLCTERYRKKYAINNNMRFSPTFYLVYSSNSLTVMQNFKSNTSNIIKIKLKLTIDYYKCIIHRSQNIQILITQKILLLTSFSRLVKQIKIFLIYNSVSIRKCSAVIITYFVSKL